MVVELVNSGMVVMDIQAQNRSAVAAAVGMAAVAAVVMVVMIQVVAVDLDTLDLRQEL